MNRGHGMDWKGKTIWDKMTLTSYIFNGSIIGRLNEFVNV